LSRGANHFTLRTPQGGPFHMRTYLYQRPSLLKYYFLASYVILVEELVRASLF